MIDIRKHGLGDLLRKLGAPSPDLLKLGFMVHPRRVLDVRTPFAGYPLNSDN